MSSYIAQQRSQFAKDLTDPTTHDQVCAMMITEDAAHPAPCLESLFNRILYCNSHGQNVTILSMLHGGFYGPYNRGMYPKTIAELHASTAFQAKMNTAIESVMAGSDAIQGFTDQGLPTDPNGMRQPQLHLGGNIFNDWGGGPGGHDGAEAWRQGFETSALQTALNWLIAQEAVEAYSELQITGKMDDATVAALKWYQEDNDACGGVDGIYGPKTRAAINNAMLTL